MNVPLCCFLLLQYITLIGCEPLLRSHTKLGFTATFNTEKTVYFNIKIPENNYIQNVELFKMDNDTDISSKDTIEHRFTVSLENKNPEGMYFAAWKKSGCFYEYCDLRHLFTLKRGRNSDISEYQGKTLVIETTNCTVDSTLIIQIYKTVNNFNEFQPGSIIFYKPNDLIVLECTSRLPKFVRWRSDNDSIIGYGIRLSLKAKALSKFITITCEESYDYPSDYTQSAKLSLLTIARSNAVTLKKIADKHPSQTVPITIPRTKPTTKTTTSTITTPTTSTITTPTTSTITTPTTTTTIATTRKPSSLEHTRNANPPIWLIILASGCGVAILFAIALLYLYFKKRKVCTPLVPDSSKQEKRCDHGNGGVEVESYATAQELTYAHLQIKSSNRQQLLMNDATPYAEIIGVLEPEHNK